MGKAVPYRVARSETGLGLFATRRIEKGEKIVEYSGSRIPYPSKIQNRYLMEVSSRTSIDGSVRSNVGRYVNHSCRPNCRPVMNTRGRVYFFALRSIPAGEEITFDYGREYLEDYFAGGRKCRCAACARSRGRKRSGR
ncbi:SET domain-containing protein [Bradyrhizobium sp. Leo121]|uniref:SET domain-containing protein n=1 Tax=Bradyrhizobium sp. Leo121 TaxID=1571195 RepID=UPI001028B43E|nr:SET domain-containing protein [Bradyrhizobium sp. Leo121]